jgi:hypothetical protein
MKDCNLVATLMELDTKLSKLEEGETINSNNYQSIIEKSEVPDLHKT